jgi:hypothetical protein
MKKVVFALALFLTPTLVFADGASRSASQEDLAQYTPASKPSPRLQRLSDDCTEKTAQKASTPSKKSFLVSFKERVSSVVQRILKVIRVVSK